MDEEKLRKLKEYFEGRKDIVMAFIFGSYAKEKSHNNPITAMAVR